MRSLVVAEIEIIINAPVVLTDTLVIPDVDLFILEREPLAVIGKFFQKPGWAPNSIVDKIINRVNGGHEDEE